MEYQEYLGIKQEMYEHFMSLIEDENDIEEDFEEIIKIIQKAKCQENSTEFKGLLHLISELDKNHHRSSTLFTKIEGILFHYSEYIKRSFTNEELLNVFSKNQRILHFLIKKNIIAVDDSMTKLLHKKHHPEFVIRQYPGENKPNYESEKAKYYAKTLMYEDYKYYFYLDVKSTLSEKERSIIEEELLRKDENIFDNFEKKCEIGENDSYISFLIRKDMIGEFVSYVTRAKISAKSEISPSIFETNPLLKSRRATLIEYAAFFGSIKIFNYLRMKNADLTPSLWIYAIHSNNADMIHILEDCDIEPEDKTYMECLKESIKCHHNKLARYIENNHFEESMEKKEHDFKNNSISYGFHYYNYEFIEYSDDCQQQLYYACLYDHFPIVKLFIKNKEVELNKTIIYNIILIKLHSSLRYLIFKLHFKI